MLRLGILPTGTILPPEQRAVRDLARKRMQLVRSRTTHILAVENITACQHGVRISSNQVKRLTVESIDQIALPDDVAFASKTNVAVITTLSTDQWGLTPLIFPVCDEPIGRAAAPKFFWSGEAARATGRFIAARLTPAG